uniref:PK_Tyr_Ser-Thr domain-containing protein n=1 Tax=Heterorhabditis bacteriophora TaxID=37862 RepID=A0A1I7WND0_HETBA
MTDVWSFGIFMWEECWKAKGVERPNFATMWHNTVVNSLSSFDSTTPHVCYRRTRMQFNKSATFGSTSFLKILGLTASCHLFYGWLADVTDESLRRRLEQLDTNSTACWGKMPVLMTTVRKKKI